MDYLQIPKIVKHSFSKDDLNKLTPQKGWTWFDQFKALVNLVPWVGGFSAQEIQNVKDYKESLVSKENLFSSL